MNAPGPDRPVHQVLTNPKYIGANIYNRRLFKLKHKRINNPVEMWIWRDGAFEPIVDAAVFDQARRIIDSRHQHLSNEALLERLKGLLQLRALSLAQPNSVPGRFTSKAFRRLLTRQ